MGDEKSITTQEEAKAGYFREALKRWSANSMEGRQIRRQDSEIVVLCAMHVHNFWEQSRNDSMIWV